VMVRVEPKLENRGVAQTAVVGGGEVGAGEEEEGEGEVVGPQAQ